jgi:lipid II:glycine glycyltransferase (peptidoglycan interpeptide bridge formation enzyme)
MKIDRTVHIVSENEKMLWDASVSHPLQSWGWGEFRIAMGIDIVRLGVYKNEKLIECWQISFHKIPYTNYTIGYFPKGPKPTKEMIEEIKKIGHTKHAIYIQLEPDTTVSEFQNWKDLSLIPSHHPLFTRFTFIIDLKKSEESLLSSMHPKTRYNIKVAQKHAVHISENNSDDAFNTYLRLSEETTQRQGFFAHNRVYQQTMWNIMKKNNIAKLWTASYNGEILASWILFVWKHTLYYPYGASSRAHRETMAPNLLLWEIIKWAKTKEISTFDLWGALGPNPDTNDPWYGFHRFKEGYNPNLVEFAGSFDYVLFPILYRIYCLSDKIRWKLLGVMGKK